jgi:hypothetical protein
MPSTTTPIGVSQGSWPRWSLSENATKSYGTVGGGDGVVCDVWLWCVGMWCDGSGKSEKGIQ